MPISREELDRLTDDEFRALQASEDQEGEEPIEGDGVIRLDYFGEFDDEGDYDDEVVRQELNDWYDDLIDMGTDF